MNLSSSLVFMTIALLVNEFVSGDYTLTVQITSYDNPTNGCPQCDGGCCDDHKMTECTMGRRCDNEFFFCTRVLGTEQSNQSESIPIAQRVITDRAQSLQCMQPPGALRSSRFKDAASVDLSSMEFQINAIKWEGIQFYVDVLDRDKGESVELIDVFVIDINPESLRTGPDQFLAASVSGIFEFASIDLNFQLNCLLGYTGELCQPQPFNNITNNECVGVICSNNGTCVPDSRGYSCLCLGDFTGEMCETRINVCEGSNCNNGTCVLDSTQTRGYSCLCLGDFSGEMCETRINVCEGVNCNNGTCVLDSTQTRGYSCLCLGDFSGEMCETRINVCEGVNCNNGTCVDKVRSFICQCNAGYSGEFCNIGIQISEKVNIVPLLVGVVAGSILFTVVIFIFCIIGLVVLMRRKQSFKDKAISKKVSGGDDDLCYEERTLDNPIYGDVYYGH